LSEKQAQTLESLLPDGRGLREFSRRLVVDGEQKEWPSDTSPSSRSRRLPLHPPCRSSTAMPRRSQRGRWP